MNVIPVGILGATGTVGQKFIRLLEHHPRFQVHEVVASEFSKGKTYKEAISHKQQNYIPKDIENLIVKSTSDSLSSKVLFSSLDSSASEIETHYAKNGHIVISNSSTHRLSENVPLIIPEVNPQHLSLIESQPWPGAIITNPNCSTMFLTMALAPVHKAFGLDSIFVSTMQAISGAGYPGVPSYDMIGNVIPYIKNEEEKIEKETLKLLGNLKKNKIENANIAISSQCNRVSVIDGHTESISFFLKEKASINDVRQAMEEFQGLPQQHNFYSAPEHPIIFTEYEDRPQPLKDLFVENGMATIVGRLRNCNIFDYKMTVLGHNTIRGAAGAAILNAELLDFYNMLA
jgi:aspartate-semialdehyde dehydrogenase